MMQSGAYLNVQRRLIGCRFELPITTKLIALYAYFMPATRLFCFKFLCFICYMPAARPCHGACDALLRCSPRAVMGLALRLGLHHNGLWGATSQASANGTAAHRITHPAPRYRIAHKR
jgi:hypothetical protein